MSFFIVPKDIKGVKIFYLFPPPPDDFEPPPPPPDDLEPPELPLPDLDGAE